MLEHVESCPYRGRPVGCVRDQVQRVGFRLVELHIGGQLPGQRLNESLAGRGFLRAAHAAQYPPWLEFLYFALRLAQAEWVSALLVSDPACSEPRLATGRDRPSSRFEYVGMPAISLTVPMRLLYRGLHQSDSAETHPQQLGH